MNEEEDIIIADNGEETIHHKHMKVALDLVMTSSSSTTTTNLIPY
jgi:hypothetical protein